MNQKELEIATMVLDDLLHAEKRGISHMHDAYWGAKMLLEEMGIDVETVHENHVLFQRMN